MPEIKSENDDDVISNTIAELLAVLVLLFFLAIGFILIELPTIEKPNTSPTVFPPGILVQESFNACNYQRSNDGTALEVMDKSINEDSNLNGKAGVLFLKGSSDLTQYGHNCLEKVCDSIIHFIDESDTIISFQIHINGHSSSEWTNPLSSINYSIPKSPQICYRTSRGEYCEDCSNDYMCNLKLSTRRAISVYDLCLSRIKIVHEDNQATILDVFEKNTRAVGFSSSQIKYKTNPDGSIEEDSSRSRRVEFSIRQAVDGN